ncbi:MAG: exodeoxyribonuclease VII small subunit [Pseudomonadota bacterium]
MSEQDAAHSAKGADLGDDTAADRVAEDRLAAMSFEEALAALESIVQTLEAGEVPLEASIALYEKGAALRAHCDAKLKAAEERVAQITFGQDGTPTGAASAEYG